MESPALPPFRNEVRWGGKTKDITISAAGGFSVDGESALVSVNEQPARTWQVMLTATRQLAPVLVAGSSIVCEFQLVVGVGSTAVKLFRSLTLSPTAFALDTEILVPATSILIEKFSLTAVAGGGQTFPVLVQMGMFCAPQFPFLERLEAFR